VDDQRVAGCQTGEQVLPASRERANALPAEAPRETSGEGPTQIGAIQHHAVEAGSGHRALQTPPDTLDLRQFGQ
jgi:hypothetical protein